MRASSLARVSLSLLQHYSYNFKPANGFLSLENELQVHMRLISSIEVRAPAGCASRSRGRLPARPAHCVPSARVSRRAAPSPTQSLLEVYPTTLNDDLKHLREGFAALANVERQVIAYRVAIKRYRAACPFFIISQPAVALSSVLHAIILRHFGELQNVFLALTDRWVKVRPSHPYMAERGPAAAAPSQDARESIKEGAEVTAALPRTHRVSYLILPVLRRASRRPPSWCVRERHGARRTLMLRCVRAGQHTYSESIMKWCVRGSLPPRRADRSAG